MHPLRIKSPTLLIATLCVFPWGGVIANPAQAGDTGFTLTAHPEQVFVMEQNQRLLLEGREIGRLRIREFVDEKTVTREAEPRREVNGEQRVYRFEGLILTQVTRLKGQRIEITLDVTNQSTHPHIGIDNLVLAEFTLPNEPHGPGWFGDKRRNTSTSLDDVAFLYAKFGTGTLGIWNASYERIVSLSLGRIRNEAGRYQLVMNTAPERVPETNDPRLMPGETRRYQIVIAAGAGEIEATVVGREAYQGFGAAYPPLLNWEDRRPIGFAILASTHKPHQTETNPRGWFSSGNLDVFSEAGKVQFREESMKFADRIIQGSKRIGAQGVIIWDIEGAENPHPITYIGDPRRLKDFAPEMDEVADEFFKRIRDQGLTVGVCIRPSRIQQTEEGKWRHRNIGHDRVKELSDKITYAKERWGCTLFYVDTPIAWVMDEERTARAFNMRSEEFEKLHRLHPDVLIIPEFTNTRDLAYTAAYEELRAHRFGNTAQTSPLRRLAYPRGFSIIKPEGGDREGRYNDLVQGVRSGDSLLIPAWYTTRDQELSIRVYKDARESPSN